MSAPIPATGGGCTARSTSSTTSTTYLADPEGYLAAHPLPIHDELLKYNRPRKEWTFDDLASSVESLEHGRSFANGKQMFQVASCVACHKLNGVGNEIGPDLTKLDPKTTPARHPAQTSSSRRPRSTRSTRRTSSRLKTGKVVTGLILEETPER